MQVLCHPSRLENMDLDGARAETRIFFRAWERQKVSATKGCQKRSPFKIKDQINCFLPLSLSIRSGKENRDCGMRSAETTKMKLASHCLRQQRERASCIVVGPAAVFPYHPIFKG